MRYTLHSSSGVEIGAADSAQRIANIAPHGTVSIDHDESRAYRFVVWHSNYPATLTGEPYMTSAEAFRAVSKLQKD